MNAAQETRDFRSVDTRDYPFVLECLICGALVRDAALHLVWHREIARGEVQ